MTDRANVLELADRLRGYADYLDFDGDLMAAAVELRHLHAEMENYRARYDTATSSDLLKQSIKADEALLRQALDALEGMVQLDVEEHRRGSGDIDICKEVQDAYATIAAIRERLS